MALDQRGHDPWGGGKPASYGQAARTTLKVAVAPTNYPGEALTEAQAVSVLLALNREIEGIVNGPFPRLGGYRLSVQGVAFVSCVDVAARDWLGGAVRQLKTWEGANLQILDGGEVPRLIKVVAWVPGTPEDPATILRRLRRQNKELRTGQWRIFDRHAEPYRTRVVLGVDGSSMGALQGAGLRAQTGAATVVFTEPKAPTEGPAKGPLVEADSPPEVEPAPNLGADAGGAILEPLAGLSLGADVTSGEGSSGDGSGLGKGELRQ